MVELAIYDMDRTITRSGTYTPWLMFWAWRRAPWRLLLLPFALLAGLGYAAGLVTRKRLKEINQSLLMGRRVTLAMLFTYAPELIGWLYVGLALNVLLALTRLWPLRRT